ncbi:TIGR04222 domain-containing membrane protein [Streptomyces piniterrae]|uniref:TIGR04222 domain-containing membrane protein n=1 Tax=Streptomyces piniterrae TaxID=2571125 RepID=A0A4U0N736_9ACTN|nr:TIGR04222 domain-containing membrane protein [Streptomyces piniterrae]TJZ49621.1 TIGR04222 domain-containing membrane protein [Streptomyces piniterrae]
MSFVLAANLGICASSLVLVTGTVRAVRAAGPPSGRAVYARTHDMGEIAFLAGGPGRVADAALAGMHADGRLAVGGPGVVTVRQAFAQDAVEAAVLDSVARTPGGALAAVRGHTMRSPAVQEIGDRLAARGLMRRPGFGQGWRRWATAQVTACVVVFLVGLLLTFADADSGDLAEAPTVFRIMPGVLAGIVVGAVCKSVCGRRVTKAGLRALGAARAAHRPGAVQSVASLVALGGAAVIADEALRQHLAEAHRTTASASASSGSSGSDSGGISPGDGSGTSWCGSSDGGSGCGSSSCGAASSCGGGGSSCGGGGSSCGGGGGCGGGS